MMYSRCGYATVHDVTKKNHEDRMESFFLGETCKYLYLVSTCICYEICCRCVDVVCVSHFWD
jgi:hypothetical protein